MRLGLYMSPEGDPAGEGSVAQPEAPAVEAPPAPEPGPDTGDNAPAPVDAPNEPAAAPEPPRVVIDGKERTVEDLERMWRKAQLSDSSLQAIREERDKLREAIEQAKTQPHEPPPVPGTYEYEDGASGESLTREEVTALLQKQAEELRQSLTSEIQTATYSSQLERDLDEAISTAVSQEDSPVFMAQPSEVSELLAEKLKQYEVNPYDPKRQKDVGLLLGEALRESHQRQLVAQERWLQSPAGQRFAATLSSGNGNGAGETQPKVGETLPSGTGVTAPAPVQQVDLKKIYDMSPEEFSAYVDQKHPELLK